MEAGEVVFVRLYQYGRSATPWHIGVVREASFGSPNREWVDSLCGLYWLLEDVDVSRTQPKAICKRCDRAKKADAVVEGS